MSVEPFPAGKVLVIAEIGGNHEGDFAEAVRLLDLAADSGAHAVKFQVYSADGLVNPRQSPDRHRHFQGFSLPLDRYVELAERCAQRGVEFMASIWETRALDALDPYIEVHKVGSGDFNAWEMIEALVATGKPLIQSCGLAEMSEVERYVEFVGALDPSYIDGQKLCLMQCSVAYPSTEADAHVSAMVAMGRATGLPVGYSDHTTDSFAAQVAVAMGARAVEMHFTDSREGKTFRDHQVSVTRDEMRRFVGTIERIHRVQGASEKTLTAAERATDHLVSFRRAVYPARDLPAGTVLGRGDLVSLRPNVGLDGREYHRLLGRRLKVAKGALEPMSWSDVEEVE